MTYFIFIISSQIYDQVHFKLTLIKTFCDPPHFIVNSVTIVCVGVTLMLTHGLLSLM